MRIRFPLCTRGEWRPSSVRAAAASSHRGNTEPQRTQRSQRSRIPSPVFALPDPVHPVHPVRSPSSSFVLFACPVTWPCSARLTAGWDAKSAVRLPAARVSFMVLLFPSSALSAPSAVSPLPKAKTGSPKSAIPFAPPGPFSRQVNSGASLSPSRHYLQNPASKKARKGPLFRPPVFFTLSQPLSFSPFVPFASFVVHPFSLFHLRSSASICGSFIRTCAALCYTAPIERTGSGAVPEIILFTLYVLSTARFMNESGCL
jgi:hypothetical protein